MKLMAVDTSLVLRSAGNFKSFSKLFTRFMLLCLFLASCARAPLSHKNQALKKLEDLPEEFLKWQESKTESKNENDSSGLVLALERALPWLIAQPQSSMNMGTLSIERGHYAQAIKNALSCHSQGYALSTILSKHFDWMSVYGRQDYGDILLTAYYSPVIKAQKKATGQLTQPIYGVPKDLVEVEEKLWFQSGLTTRPNAKTMRLLAPIASPEGDMRPPRLAPYFSRAEIDRMGQLDKGTAILGFVDPIDAFFLHIQGSGKLHFADNTYLQVGYAAQNGHPYYSIGKSLWDHIPQEEMSMARIEAHLRSLPVDVRNRILDLNPSYIFFRPLKEKAALTTSGAQAVSGISAAVDNSLFPLGMIGWLWHPSPTLTADQVAPTFSPQPDQGRFVVAHDTGGAIKGADRLDLFWGEGHEAMQIAGAFRHPARLYWLAPKASITNANFSCQ